MVDSTLSFFIDVFMAALIIDVPTSVAALIKDVPGHIFSGNVFRQSSSIIDSSGASALRPSEC